MQVVQIMRDRISALAILDMKETDLIALVKIISTSLLCTISERLSVDKIPCILSKKGSRLNCLPPTHQKNSLNSERNICNLLMKMKIQVTK